MVGMTTSHLKSNPSKNNQPEPWYHTKGHDARFDSAREIITIDGLRVEYADGFGLARPSNTTPIIVLRFEADTTDALHRIQADFRKALLAVKPGAELPF